MQAVNMDEQKQDVRTTSCRHSPGRMKKASRLSVAAGRRGPHFMGAQRAIPT